MKKMILLLPLFLMLCVTAQTARAQEGTQDAGEAQSEASDTDSSASAEETTDTEDSGEEGASAEEGTSQQTVITLVGRYDSADTAAIIGVNENAMTISFKNHDTGRNYTLFYDTASRFTDAYGREFSASTLESGTLVDVTFLKSTKHLNSLRIAKGEDVWVYEDQRNYALPTVLSVSGPTVSSMATIAGGKYLMDIRSLVLVEDKEASPAQIVEGDIIRVSGVGHEVYSVKVTRGHGYLKLSSDVVRGTSLVGAWIELDNVVIRRISEKMLMTAPEGEYTMYIIGNGANHSAPVTIARGRETVVDVSGIEIEPVKEGKIRFDITPSDAEIRVNGRKLELSSSEESISLTYGIHQIELSREGYETMVRYLRVGAPSAVLRLEMTRDGSMAAASSGTSDATSASGNSASSGSGSTSGNSASSGNSTSSGTSGTSGNSASSGTDETSGNSASSGDSNTSGNGASSGSADSASTGSSDNAANGAATDNNAGTDNTQNGGTQNGGTQQTPYRIYVDTPSGASLYVDGNFMGFIPVSFEKVTGTHTITLQQEGRRTISYNIEVEQGAADKTFNFPPLDLE